MLGQSQDEFALVPLRQFEMMFGSRRQLNLTVKPRDLSRIAEAMDETMSLTEQQMTSMQAVSEQLARLNAVILDAVDAGVSIELHRSERYHCGGGCWGDMMKPVVVKCRTSEHLSRNLHFG